MLSDLERIPADSSRDALGCEMAAEVLRSWGRLRLRVTGVSMLPAVWPGDILLVQSHDAAEAAPGDIVLFQRAGRLVAHRVVKRTISQQDIQWLTRGDTMGCSDAPISRGQLLGRVAAIERGSRRFTPRRSVAGRLASWLLSRSDLATRALLKVGTRGGQHRGCKIRDTGKTTSS